MKRERRVFDVSLKLAVVKEYEEGIRTVRELANSYNIPASTVYSWTKKSKQNQIKAIDQMPMIDITNEAKEIVQGGYQERIESEIIKIRIKHIEMDISLQSFERIWKIITK